MGNIVQVDTGPATQRPLLPRQSSSSTLASDTVSDSKSTSAASMMKENPRIVSDIVIGLSDGLQVPFALAAGLSSLGSNRIVVAGALAELIAGSLSMGAGGWLAGNSESAHYLAVRKGVQHDLMTDPDMCESEIIVSMQVNGVSEPAARSVAECLRGNPPDMVDYIMSLRGLERPTIRTALFSGFTIGASYFVGGLIPLLPYLFIDSLKAALAVSIVVALVTLFIFGYVKSRLLISSRTTAFVSATQTLVIGGVAAAVSYAAVYLLEGRSRDP